MTRARTLKSTIRARMLKTGERYTAARRHVLAASAAPAAPPAAAPTPARPAPARSSAAASADPRGAVSDTKVLEKTGRDLAHWFDVLDRFGAVAKGHTAAARHLHDGHGVPGWYAQGITVAYERQRGLRRVNQRTNGTFEVTASKLLPADLARVAACLEATTSRARWTADLDAALVRALVAGLRGPTAKGLTTKANGQRRCRFTWDATVVELMLTPRGDRTHAVVTHSKLATAHDVERQRARWRDMLAALALVVAVAPAAPAPSTARR